MKIKLKNSKSKVAVCRCIISQRKEKKKKMGYIIPAMDCYPRNGQLRDPDFTRHKLYHPNQ